MKKATKKIPTNLDDVWSETISMFGDIVVSLGDGFIRHWWEEVCGDIVPAMKEVWLSARGYDPSRISNQCFFCHYDSMYGHCTSSCDGCPGKLVDPTFNCMATDCCYEEHPEAFYQKLVALNRKRLRRARYIREKRGKARGR
jgi:hypothetical protein